MVVLSISCCVTVGNQLLNYGVLISMRTVPLLQILLTNGKKWSSYYIAQLTIIWYNLNLKICRELCIQLMDTNNYLS